MHVTAASSSRPAAPPGGPAPRRRAPTVRAAATPSAPEAQEKKGLRVSMVRYVVWWACSMHGAMRPAAAGLRPAVRPPHSPPRPPCCSLGCPKNTVDGEVLLGDLYRSGFEITDAQDEARRCGSRPTPMPAVPSWLPCRCRCTAADVPSQAILQADAIVINTCGFVEDAKDESIEVQRRHAWWRQQQARLIGRIRRVHPASCGTTRQLRQGVLQGAGSCSSDWVALEAAGCRPAHGKPPTLGAPAVSSPPKRCATARPTPLSTLISSCPCRRRAADHHRGGAHEGGWACEAGGGDGVPGAALLSGAGGAAARGRPGGGVSEAAMPLSGSLGWCCSQRSMPAPGCPPKQPARHCLPAHAPLPPAGPSLPPSAPPLPLTHPPLQL